MFIRIIIGVIIGFVLGLIMVRDSNNKSLHGEYSGAAHITCYVAIGYVLYSSSYGFGYFVLGLVEVVVGLVMALGIFGKSSEGWQPEFEAKGAKEASPARLGAAIESDEAKEARLQKQRAERQIEYKKALEALLKAAETNFESDEEKEVRLQKEKAEREIRLLKFLEDIKDLPVDKIKIM